MTDIIFKAPPEQEIMNVYILADAHIGDKYSNIEALTGHIKSIEDDPLAGVILNGDVLNMATTNSVSDTYTETMSPDYAIDFICDLLEPIVDKILVITEGNHENRIGKADGVHIMRQVAKRLGIFDKYAETAYMLFVSVGKYNGRTPKDRVRQMTYAIYGKHGYGGGKRVGSKMNRVEDMRAICDADVYIHAHTHTPAAFKLGFNRVDYRNKSTQTIEQLFINANAWLDYGGYGEAMGFSPASLSPPKVRLYSKRKFAEVTL